MKIKLKKLKIKLLKFTLTISLLFLGLTNTKAACVDDCYFHIFQKELSQDSSKKIRNYFKELSDEDAKKAYNSWTVLYKSDEKADRLSIDNLEVLTKYMSDSKKTVNIVASEINNLKSFKKWKDVETQFQSEGYKKYIDDILNLVDKTDQPQLKKDIESSKDLVKLFTNNPNLLNSWKIFHELKVSKEFRVSPINMNAMHNYIEKIHKVPEEEFSLKSLNKYVKHILNKDAYLKSILFTNELYGGIKIPQELLSDIKPLTSSDEEFIRSFMQYSGVDNHIFADFGTFEVRINNGKIQRHMVDENNVGSWENITLKTYNPTNYVITMDGKLRLGYGHHNISGEAFNVISAGTMTITNGVITEISNSSGHYVPSKEHLVHIGKVFEKLGLTSDDFKLFSNPNSGH